LLEGIATCNLFEGIRGDRKENNSLEQWLNNKTSP